MPYIQKVTLSHCLFNCLCYGSDTVFVFENADGEAMKLTLRREGTYKMEFFRGRIEKIGEENEANIDYIVENKLKVIK